MESIQTGLQGTVIVGTFIVLVLIAGLGVTVLLLQGEWRKYQLCLSPVIGWSILTLALFFINVFAPVQTGIFMVLVPAVALDVFIVLRRRHLIDLSRDGLYASLIGLGLVGFALIPHAIQRSLGQIILNQDEELYFTAANYVLNFPADSNLSPWSAAFLHWRNWGWGFQYTIASVSAVSGVPTFTTYIPTSYCLLGLSVIAWYVLFREIFVLSQTEASIACLLYSLLGLPLWFAAYGYGPQMASLIALPLGISAVAAAIRNGSVRMFLLAGIAISAGLASFYRGIGLQYVFTMMPLGILALIQQRSLRPLARAAAIVAMASVVGLPAHWQAGQWYFVQGAIMHPEWLDLTGGGWGIENFQPPEVMLGLDAFPVARDEEGKGPLARLDTPLDAIADPATLVVLILAGVGLVSVVRKQPAALAVTVGTAASLAFTRYAMHYPYGYIKLMPNSAPVVYAFFVAACGIAWRNRRITPRLGLASVSRLPIVALLAITTTLLGYNTYEALWCNTTGWGQSIPGWIPNNLHSLAKTLPQGSKVFLAGRFTYPVPPERVRVRQHMLGMTDDKETAGVWARRVREIAMTELLPLDVYTWFDRGLVFSDKQRLLDDESYDYYLLGPENDPRLEGLDSADMVWSDPGLALYKTEGVVRKTAWGIRVERGSLAILPDKPLQVAVSANRIATNGGGFEQLSSQSRGRIRIGILSFDRSEASIETANGTTALALEAGLTWYTSSDIPLPSTVTVRPVGNARLGVVTLRLLGAGLASEELVPSGVIRDDIYASSTVLRLEHWLTDPFKGKKPGSD